MADHAAYGLGCSSILAATSCPYFDTLSVLSHLLDDLLACVTVRRLHRWLVVSVVV